MGIMLLLKWTLRVGQQVLVSVDRGMKILSNVLHTGASFSAMNWSMAATINSLQCGLKPCQIMSHVKKSRKRDHTKCTAKDDLLSQTIESLWCHLTIANPDEEVPESASREREREREFGARVAVPRICDVIWFLWLSRTVITTKATISSSLLNLILGI